MKNIHDKFSTQTLTCSRYILDVFGDFQEGTRLMMSLLVPAIIQYLDGNGRTSESMAYVYTGLLCLGNLFIAVGFNYHLMDLNHLAMNMRSTCAIMIYKKVCGHEIKIE